MKVEVDPNNQPLNPLFNRERNFDRDISEMIGLIKGLLADGILSVLEVQAAYEWFETHSEICHNWPGDVLSQRVKQAISDGVVSEDERNNLQDLFTRLARNDITTLNGMAASTSLPLNDPPPIVAFPRKTFVLTGTFAFGPRKECERFTITAGGKCDSAVTLRTNYLVIGTFVSRDWAHSIYGRKIERAMEMRAGGTRLAIISEDQWAGALP